MGRAVGDRGFTTAELLVASVLAAMVFASLAAFYATGVKHQVDGFRRMVVQNRALMALKVIQAEVSQVTRLEVPPVGGAATEVIRGGINVRPAPDNGGQELVNWTGGDDRRWFHICIGLNDPAACPMGGGHRPRCMWLYRGTGWPPPTIACGVTPGGEVLASPIPDTSSLAFTRPWANMVRANFVVRQPEDKERGVPEIAVPVTVEIRTRQATN